MPPLHDPKALTESLELDYVRRPRAFHRWFTRCTWGAFAGALVCAAWIVWPTNRATLEAGPVSTPHAMFNQDCEKCHTAPFATATRLAGSVHGLHSTQDPACLQCHPAPDHNRLVAANNCADCHKEHRGDTLLARPGERHCTGCHAPFKDKYGTESPHFDNVASFAAHPEFALWRGKIAIDPGNVEFSHLKHLQLRVEDHLTAIDEPVRQLNKMECAYCHQPDAAGNLMAPIQFDKHCQDCHPLLLPMLNGKLPDSLKPTILAFLKKPVPHPQKGQSAWDVRSAARQRYLEFAQSNAAILKLPSATPEEWQVLPGMAQLIQPATQAELGFVNEQWKQGESMLFDRSAGCAHCHAQISKKDLGPDDLPRFDLPTIPQRWLQHSVFDHQAHRGLDCLSCHEGALKSDTRKDVLLPKLASCQSCHQASTGFARADCVECHQFHRRAGAPLWQGRLKIEDYTGHGQNR